MKIVILGGGIGGIATAIALSKEGFSDISIYERSPSPRTSGGGIVLWPNACNILDKLGIYDPFLKECTPINNMNRYTIDGQLTLSIPIHRLKNTMQYPSMPILRKDFQKLLISELGHYNIEINYGYAAVNIEENPNKRGKVYFEKHSPIDFDILIGADGRMNSMTRKHVIGDNKPNDLRYTNWVGVANFEQPHVFKQDIHDYWGNDMRFGIVPLNDMQVYWAGCIRNDRLEANQLSNKLFMDASFRNWDSVIKEVISKTKDENMARIHVFDHNPIQKWSTKNVCLIGDAAHAVSPTTGQGAALALEDAWVLARLLKQYKSIPEKAFELYTKKRLPKSMEILRAGRSLTNQIFFSENNKEYPQITASQMLDGMKSLWSDT